MTKEIYTGQLMYKNIDFSFVFNGIELRLIPPKEKELVVAWEWKMQPIGNGVYTMGDILYMPCNYHSMRWISKAFKRH